MDEGKPEKVFKNSVCGINSSVARKIVRDKFLKDFRIEFNEKDLTYNENENRYDIILKVEMNGMGEKDKKKLKERIHDLETSKEFFKVFKVIEVQNVSRTKVEL